VLVVATPVAGAEDDPPPLGYGMMLAYPPDHLELVKAAGFDWFKYFAYWHAVDPEQDRTYNWETVDWRLNEACEHELNILLRVERDSADWTPIRDGEMAAWEAFFTDLVAHILAHQAACETPYRAALEIWNEPNLDFQWGYQPVDPARYTEMVKRAYRGAKAAPGGAEIPIIAGSLAPTGGMSGGRAMNDVDFLTAMYAAGLQGHFDAISIHNYGFGGPPEDKTWSNGITNFRRAEDIHAVMAAHGDGALPVWATEFGWLLASEACDGYWHEIGFAWQ
jgi:polysaccharide biosynthesis protein PslG